MNKNFEAAVGRFGSHLERVYGKNTTSKHYVSDLSIFSQKIDKAPRDVRRGDVTDFITSQLESGMGRSTVNRRLASLSSFFVYLADEAEDESWENPVCWRHHGLETGHHLPRDLKDQTARRFWASVAQGPIRDQAMVALMLDVGLRVGEVASLKIDSFDASEKLHGLSSLRVRGKGNKERRVWLVPETSKLMSDYIEERGEVSDSGLFITRRHKAISVRGIQERVKNYTRKAGIEESSISCHRLRHTFARRMAEARMPLPSLSNWLGHGSLKTTQIYINGANPLLRADYEAAMNVLSRTAECSDEAVAYPAAASAQGAVAEGENRADYAPALDDSFIRSRLTEQPLWLADLIVAFIRHQQMRWKAYPRRRRAQQWLGELRRSWQWLLEQGPIHSLADLKKADMKEYLLQLHDNELSPHHINHIMTTFFAFLHFSEDRGEAVSPALYRIKRPERGEDLPRPLLPSEFSQLEQSVLSKAPCSTQERLDHAWFLVLADGGLRISELVTLTVNDWDSQRQSLLIQEPKFYRERRIPLTNRASLAIDAHLQERAASLSPEQPLLARSGLLLQPTYVRSQLHGFAQQAQLEHVTPHRLRHTFATRLLNSGKMPITSLQKLMGHRHIDTTMRYVKLYDSTLQHDYQLAMATSQEQTLPEPDPSIWASAIPHSFEQPYEQSQPISYCM